jgi:hypothetical protein
VSSGAWSTAGIPREWGWTLSHAFGGAGVYTVASGLQSIEGMRIHNVEDGRHPRETPSFKLRADDLDPMQAPVTAPRRPKL